VERPARPGGIAVPYGLGDVAFKIERAGFALLPGSHRVGRLAQEQIESLCARQPEHLCTAAAGDALLMRPLLLHASRRSTGSRLRRILHIEYAGFSLPNGLAWHEGA